MGIKRVPRHKFRAFGLRFYIGLTVRESRGLHAFTRMKSIPNHHHLVSSREQNRSYKTLYQNKTEQLPCCLTIIVKLRQSMSNQIPGINSDHREAQPITNNPRSLQLPQLTLCIPIPQLHLFFISTSLLPRTTRFPLPPLKQPNPTTILTHSITSAIIAPSTTPYPRPRNFESAITVCVVLLA